MKKEAIWRIGNGERINYMEANWVSQDECLKPLFSLQGLLAPIVSHFTNGDLSVVGVGLLRWMFQKFLIFQLELWRRRIVYTITMTRKRFYSGKSDYQLVG